MILSRASYSEVQLSNKHSRERPKQRNISWHQRHIHRQSTYSGMLTVCGPTAGSDQDHWSYFLPLLEYSRELTGSEQRERERWGKICNKGPRPMVPTDVLFYGIFLRCLYMKNERGDVYCSMTSSWLVITLFITALFKRMRLRRFSWPWCYLNRSSGLLTD